MSRRWSSVAFMVFIRFDARAGAVVLCNDAVSRLFSVEWAGGGFQGGAEDCWLGCEMCMDRSFGVRQD